MPQLEEKISKQAAQGEYNLCPVKSRVMVLIVRIECISFTKNYNLCQALYSAGDRTDFGIPGMRQVFGYRQLVTRPESRAEIIVHADRVRQ